MSSPVKKDKPTGTVPTGDQVASQLTMFEAKLSPDQEKLVQKVSQIVQDKTGVQLGANRKAMVNSRIFRRMAKLGMTQPEQYLAHLEKNPEHEVNALISLLTTHHTHFFREFQHLSI